ncbi:MAG: DUF4340 domain-containing protein [Anaerolineales bacterium]|nr:DUF4340 domain-containing protein [Anaerolineales bacterium]
MARKTTTSTKKSAPRKASSTRKESASPKQQKPVFRAGTVITLLLLAVMVLLAIYLNREKEAADIETTSTSEVTTYVFGAENGNVSSIEIKPADGETVKVARDENNVWAIELPFEAEADQGAVEASATQISALTVVSEVEGDPEIFGLNEPIYVITIEYADGKTHTLEVGDATPTNSGYYVRVDKEKMMITGLSGIDSLANLVFFPPYLYTPTPTALPATATPVPPTEAATATPTP